MTLRERSLRCCMWLCTVRQCRRRLWLLGKPEPFMDRKACAAQDIALHPMQDAKSLGVICQSQAVSNMLLVDLPFAWHFSNTDDRMRIQCRPCATRRPGSKAGWVGGDVHSTTTRKSTAYAVCQATSQKHASSPNTMSARKCMDVSGHRRCGNMNTWPKGLQCHVSRPELNVTAGIVLCLLAARLCSQACVQRAAGGVDVANISRVSRYCSCNLLVD